MTAAERHQRTAEADRLCAEAFETTGCPDAGVALIAVGGYGRGELAPYSDLDLVLVLDDHVTPGEWAGGIWYPLWDSGRAIDHSVRNASEMIAQAAADLKVALGLLDARHLAGDPNLTLRVRTTLLTTWRREARQRLPELHRLVAGRGELLGELAHSAVPDLKESQGGLRDATALKALVATWLVDVPHADLERSRTALLDVRDALHAVAGRNTDRVAPEYWPDIATRLGFDDATSVQRHTRALGRRITHLSRITWSRAEAALRRPTSARTARRPALAPVGSGIAISNDEVVLGAGVRPGADPLLLLRASAEAAERNLVLSPSTAARLVREGAPLPTPWPDEARDLFVRLLAAGPGLLPVWETLDETDALSMVLPEWEEVRLLPHASVVHRFTVDRHMVETCIEASRLIRQVARPDMLMVAALLHDIGKGRLTEHSIAGAPIAREIAVRMGFDERQAELIQGLVRWHLLLPEIATTRDPEDPATVSAVLDKVGDREELELLSALTQADALATSQKAWTTWRASLVRQLTLRCLAALGDEAAARNAGEDQAFAGVPATVLRTIATHPDKVEVLVDERPDATRVTVVARDRVGLLADAAAMLALQRVGVRAARAWTDDHVAVSRWDLPEVELDATVLRQRLEAIVAGRIDARERLGRRMPSRLDPSVAVRPEASHRATVLEVRTQDHPGVIYAVCRALADLDITVGSAHIATLGPQAVDAFYVHEASAGALSEERAAEAAHAVREALTASPQA